MITRSTRAHLPYFILLLLILIFAGTSSEFYHPDEHFQILGGLASESESPSFELHSQRRSAPDGRNLRIEKHSLDAEQESGC